jgi:putative flippase GtrA
VTSVQTVKKEGALGLKHVAVSLSGFAVDAVLLQLLMAAGLEPAWSRVVSLALAMQVTFALNGVLVFKTLPGSGALRQWARYMAANGLGNLCNYWVFVTLVSTHWPLIAAPMAALCVGAFAAWAINYLSARFLVFRRSETSGRPSIGLRRGP